MTDPIREERKMAWTGDAVLCLFAREWILREFGEMEGAMQTRMTSNHFLSSIGNPTSVEAEIGRIFRAEGLEAAFAHIETNLLPTFRKQEKKRKT